MGFIAPRLMPNPTGLFPLLESTQGLLGLRNVAKTASYTILQQETGTQFNTLGATGAITFTLPAPAQGLFYDFYNAVNQNLVITAPSAIFNGKSDATLNTTATFSTGSKAGVACRVWSDGTNWYMVNWTGATITWS